MVICKFLKGNKLFSVFLKFLMIITHCKALQKETLGSASSTSSSVLEHTTLQCLKQSAQLTLF